MYRSRIDQITRITTGLASLGVGLLVVWIGYFLLMQSMPSLTLEGASIFISNVWEPSESAYGVLNMLLATAVSSAAALLIALPTGVLIALQVEYFSGSRLRRVLRVCLDLLAGIPSVVYGFWGLVVLVPAINQIHPPGASLLAATLILTLMILPTVALLGLGALERIEKRHQLAANALSISKETFIYRVVLPHLRPDWMKISVLSLARAAGETMAVIMVCGNVANFPDSFFTPVRTLTANMALEMAYAMDIHQSALFASGLVLFAAVATLIVVSFRFQGRAA